MHTLIRTAALVAAFALGTSVGAQTRVVYGLMHAHTSYSDGSGTPTEAFAMSKQAGLHFFAVTPHNHAAAESGAKERTDGVLIALDPQLYEADGNVTVRPANAPAYQSASVIRAARDASGPDYVALYGQEFSTISAGNHMNVFGVPRVLTAGNGDFRALFTGLDALVQGGAAAPVVQLNHPDVHADLFYSGNNHSARVKMFNDYGFDDYGGDFAAMVAAMGKYVVLCEILSGPAMTKANNPNYRYDDHHENDYYFYLGQGFHLSPSVGQDNHYKTWGTSTPARMGVHTTALTAEALYDAMRSNRTFATEDSDLALEFSINGEPMGSCLDIAPGQPLAITVGLRDASEPNARYDVTLVHGPIVPQNRASLTKRLARDGERESQTKEGDGNIGFAGFIATGEPEFYYVRVRQNGNDRAWSGPIWLNHPRAGAAPAAEAAWVWTASSSSRVYHYMWCKVAENIAAHNRRTGTTPPSGRSLHDCQRPADEPEH